MSTIKVNKLEQRTGCTATVGGGAGKTVTVDATTITLGRCGGTVSLASGASQTGFGRTGAVDWCTTAKTSPFTATSGKGFFINTSGGAVTVTLPSSPSGGDIVSIKDYSGTFDVACKAVTIGRGGSKIQGICADAVLNTKGDTATLIYVDGTKGWINVETDDTVTGDQFITATGGTITTVDTNFKVHTFNADGTFCVSAGAGPVAVVDYMVVAGGGGGGGAGGPNWGGAGGGGAGGFREAKTGINGTHSASALATTTGVPVGVRAYTVTVGAGGSPGGNGACSAAPQKGSDSVFGPITSAGGGGGGPATDSGCGHAGGNGGSGGGGSICATATAGTGNVPAVFPPQGQNGGSGPGMGAQPASFGGGGGATAVGSSTSPGTGRPGGQGATTSISGSPVSKSGGGGSGNSGPSGGGTGGTGGGGAGGKYAPTPVAAVAGTTNSGGGGGGGGSNNGFGASGGSGGSGQVVIRYKFQ